MSIFINGGFVGRRITGLQRYALEVSQRLVKKDGIRVIAPAGEECAYIHERHLLRKKKPAISKFISGAWDIALSRDVKKKDLLWSPCNLGPAVRNHVVTIHDLAVFKNPEWFSTGFALKYRFLLPEIVNTCARIITDTKTVQREICDFFSIAENKVIVAPLGVSNDLLDGNRTHIPDNLGKLLDTPYFVTLGSIDPRKNLQFLLDEWRLFQGKKPGANLLIVGAGSGAFSRQHLSIPPDCKLLGYLPDPEVAVVIRNARALIYPSLYEGFSFPPLEALALDTPVIISDIPVHRENYSGLAHFFDPYRRGSLVDILQADNIEKVDTEVVSQLLKSRYNWDTCSEIIYKTLLACHGRFGEGQ